MMKVAKKDEPAAKIPGKPEGRPGVWLITPETAIALVDALPGDEIHNFINSGNAMFLGANWPKKDARKLLRSLDKTIALLFEPNVTMRHQLVAIDDANRYAFDVGVIDESRMEEVVGG